MKSSKILFIFLFIIIIGCKDNISNPTSGKEIWPLKVGNLWAHQYTKFDSLGNIRSSLIDTLQIGRDSLALSQNIYKFIHTRLSGGIEYVWNQSDGLHFYNKISGELIDILMFKFPASQGEICVYGTDTLRVESVNFSYKTQAVSFNCYKYVSEGWANEYYHRSINFLCPDIGLVAEEYWGGKSVNNLQLNQKVELIAYSLK